MAKKPPQTPPPAQPAPLTGEVLPPKGKQGGARRGAGRKEFKPNDEQRRIVQAAIGIGLRQMQVRMLIMDPTTGNPISKPTLEKHFAHELATGKARAHFTVGKSLYDQAVGIPKMDAAGKKQVGWISEPVPAATIWFTKSQMGFREKGRIDVSAFETFVESIGGNVLALRAIRAEIRSPED